MNFLVRFVIKVILYTIVFIGLVWALLGIKPQETVSRSKNSLAAWKQAIASVFDDTVKTAVDMKNVAGSELHKASDRIDGKDPYTDVAAQLDAQIQKGMQ